MEFKVNHPVLFVLVGIIIAAVIGQSVYFLIKSYRRAKANGMDMAKVNKTIKTAAIFTIAPAPSKSTVNSQPLGQTMQVSFLCLLLIS